LELGGPLSPEALGSLPTLPKVKAGPGLGDSNVGAQKLILHVTVTLAQ